MPPLRKNILSGSPKVIQNQEKKQKHSKHYQDSENVHCFLENQAMAQNIDRLNEFCYSEIIDKFVTKLPIFT